MTGKREIFEDMISEQAKVLDARLTAIIKAWPFVWENAEIREEISPSGASKKAWKITPNNDPRLDYQSLDNIVALLLSKDRIWKAIEAEIVAGKKKRGAPRKASHEKRYPAASLIELARSFEPFESAEKEKARSRGATMPTRENLIVAFRKDNGERFPWLPRNKTTAANILARASAALDGGFAIINIDGREHVLLADGARAARHLIKAGMDKMLAQVLELPSDAPKAATMLRNAKRHAVRICWLARRKGYRLAPGPSIARVRR